MKKKNKIQFKLWIVYIICAVFLTGCAGTNTIRRDITTHLRNVGIIRPYIADSIFDAKSDLVVEMLINTLSNQGAKILTWDKNEGVVSWHDTGSYFIPLPGMSEEIKTHNLTNSAVTFWRGYVYGSARIVEFNDQSWLSIRTTGRDVRSGKRIYSDGTYEWRLISSLKRTFHRVATGQKIIPEFQKPKASISRSPAKNYEDLFKSHFNNFPRITSSLITKTIEGESYPVVADRLWKAVLDVVTQYSIIPYFNKQERLIVFSYRVLVPIDIETKKRKPLDVVVAITVQAENENSDKSVILYFSLLGENNLEFRKIEKKSPESNTGGIDLNSPPLDIAASMTVNPLVQQIESQLFYNKSLGRKLLRRLIK